MASLQGKCHCSHVHHAEAEATPPTEALQGRHNLETIRLIQDNGFKQGDFSLPPQTSEH